MASVTFQGISKRFGQTDVLRDVSLTIADGEFVALLGPSGCGKTTLLRILAGLETQSEGQVLLGDRAVDDLPPKARDVAMVFQNYALYPYMSVRKNVALPLVMRRLSSLQRLPLIGRFMPGAGRIGASIHEAVERTCAGLGLGHLLDRRPGQLSGGQRQRVALARAMVREPAAFLMDEPLSNLDAKLRHQARQEIASLHRELGATFIYVTHDQVEAMTMADRVAVMLDGAILQVGPPQELYNDPQDIRVATFIGAPQINRLAGTVGDNDIVLAGMTLPIRCAAARGSAVEVCFRPEAVGLSADGTGLLMRIRNIEHLGPETLVHGRSENGAFELVTRIAPTANNGLKIGGTAHFALDPAAAMVFDGEGRRLAIRSEPTRHGWASPAAVVAHV